MRKRKMTAQIETKVEFAPEKLRKSLLKDARALGMPNGTAEVITEKVTEKAEKWLELHKNSRKGELEQQILAELQKYSADLAYVFQNRGKII